VRRRAQHGAGPHIHCLRPAADMWRVSRCCGPGGIHSRMMSHGSGGSGGGQQTEMLARAAQLFPGGSNGNTIYQDTVISYGRGARVYDVDGREYIDYVMGGGPMMLGHAHPSVTAAVAERMPCGTSFFGLTQAIIEHATELSRHFPCAEQVRYCSSGTEATLFALRAARALSGKPMVLKFEGAYHGMNDYGLMSLLPEEPLRPFPQPSPSSVSISKQLEAEVLIAPFNDLETTAQVGEGGARTCDTLCAVCTDWSCSCVGSGMISAAGAGGGGCRSSRRTASSWGR
jgi:glutamate-1-semialdehyde aminotransferase